MKFLFGRYFKGFSKEDAIFYAELKKVLKFNPIDINTYKKAFTHSSLRLKDSKGNAVNYQRLEFLGDAMLDSVISSFLYTKAPHGDEGYLTKMRSKIVSREHLNDLGIKLDLMRFVKINVPECNISPNIHGDVFEALIGAIYVDRGYRYCSKFISSQIIHHHVNIEQLEQKIINYKGLLIEWCQKNKKKYLFETYEDTGNQDQKHFSVKILIDDNLISKGRATSKKKAEVMAAKRAYYVYQKHMKS